MYYSSNRISSKFFADGTLPSATPVVIPLKSGPLPMAITLKSSDAGRLIELSTDGGTEYFTPTVDKSSATMQVVALTWPATHTRLTGGAAGTDTYTVI